MKSTDAVNAIYEDAKTRGFKVSNMKMAERRNRRGTYTFIEVQYLVPGEPVADEPTATVKPVTVVTSGIETPEDTLLKTIETR